MADPPASPKDEKKRGAADNEPLTEPWVHTQPPRPQIPKKKMCVVSSGRVGAKAHAGAIMQLLRGAPGLRHEMISFCAALDVSLDWASFDDEELRGLDASLLRSMGVAARPAERISHQIAQRSQLRAAAHARATE